MIKNFNGVGAALQNKTSLRISLMVIIAVGLVISLWAWQKNGSGNNLNTQNEANDLITKVSQLITLPTDEIPTIATVSDPNALKNQDFFAQAKKGYKVLIYAKAGKAILYDPIGNKVVEIAPINLNANLIP